MFKSEPPINIPTRPTQAEIDLDRLRYNLRSIRKFIGESHLVMAVVKADAYGHGAIQCAQALEKEGVDWFGVALPEEGIELRNAEITTPILCFGNWPGQEDAMLFQNLTPVVYQIERAAAFDAAAARLNQTAKLHIKIDTGMGRVGVPATEVADFAVALKQFQNVEVEGLMTHFAAADEVVSDQTNLQMRLFAAAAETFHANGFQPELIDMANSPGAIVHPDSRATMVRIGGLLYGLGGDVLPRDFPGPDLRPVLSLRSHISYVKTVPTGTTIGYGGTFLTERESVIATVPIGYHDGLPRVLSNNGSVLVNGKRAPIVGRVSMDWTIIDVTDVGDASVGTEVVLLGEQLGQKIRAEDLAELATTISYEITCGLGSRVPRVYLDCAEAG